MTPILIALALVATGGAIVAVSGREPRLATLGAVIAMLAAADIADPLPGTVALATQLVGTVLGGYLVWISLRGWPAPAARPSQGWTGATAIAIAAFVAGWLAATTIGSALATTSSGGPSISVGALALAGGSLVSRAGVATAFALGVLALGPVLFARDVLRLGLGALLLLAAAERLTVAFTVRTEDTLVLAFAVVFAAGGAAVAGLVARSLRTHGDLLLRVPSQRAATVRSRGVDEAHPAGRRR